jgi:phage terminase large subunit
MVKNRTDNFYKINNSTIEFFGTDNLAKVHGPARDILLINEANYIKESVYDHLAIRTKETVFMDFNPTRRFFYHDSIQGKIPHAFIQSTYKDNQFLTPVQVQRIEDKRSNENWFRVYGEGELGRLEGAIIKNWRFGEFDNTLDSIIYGLDFGVRDPDALIKVAIDFANKKVYWKEEMYQSEQGTTDLASALKARVINNRLIVADSAGTRTIIDLKKLGFNIIPAIKPKLIERIRAIEDFELIVDPDSFNMQKELNEWVWLDKKGEVPIDDMNHLIDAGMYAFWWLYTNAGRRRRPPRYKF